MDGRTSIFDDDQGDPDPPGQPTPEAVDEYDRMLIERDVLLAKGGDTTAIDAEIKQYMLANGIGESCPVDADGEPD